MSKKNIFLIAAWYIAGWLVASIYNKKKPEQLKKELLKAKETWEGSFKILLDTFVDTQANLIEDIKKEILSEKNIKLFNEHKEEIFKILDSYKEKGNLLLEELKVNWKDYLVIISEKLEKLYNEKISEIESLKWIAPEKMEELKDKLLSAYEDLKKEIMKIKK